jgi:thioredoxin 1
MKAHRFLAYAICFSMIVSVACAPSTEDTSVSTAGAGDGCTIDEEMLGAGVPVLIHFTTPGDALAERMTEVMLGVREDFDDRLTVVEIDAEECSSMAGEYGVLRVPTVVLLRTGEETVHVVGSVSRDHLDSWLVLHGVTR